MKEYYVLVFLDSNHVARNYALFNDEAGFERAKNSTVHKTKAAFEQCDAWCTGTAEFASCAKNMKIAKQAFIVCH